MRDRQDGGSVTDASRSLQQSLPHHHQGRLLAPQNPVGKASAHAPRDFMLSDLLVEIEQAEAGTATATATTAQ